MKVLFDECMPRPLRRLLSGIEIKTAQEMGWGRLKNGDLLKKAEGAFDVLVTADRNLRYQQNLSGRNLAILVLSTNRLPALRSKKTEIAAAIRGLKPGDYIELAL